MFSLDEIKKEAELAALAMDINWDNLEDPKEREYLETRLKTAAELLPTIESLYSKLTSGKNLVLPDAETALPFEEVEQYIEAVAEELYSGYILQSISDRYEKVNSIIALSGSKG